MRLDVVQVAPGVHQARAKYVAYLTDVLAMAGHKDAAAAAKLDVKAARANFYPSFRITAEAGMRAFKPVYLTSPESMLYNLAGDMIAPLVNRNAIKAAYNSANIKAEFVWEAAAKAGKKAIVFSQWVDTLDRIAERLERFGASALSDTELLALLRRQLGGAGAHAAGGEQDVARPDLRPRPLGGPQLVHFLVREGGVHPHVGIHEAAERGVFALLLHELLQVQHRQGAVLGGGGGQQGVVHPHVGQRAHHLRVRGNLRVGGQELGGVLHPELLARGFGHHVGMGRHGAAEAAARRKGERRGDQRPAGQLHHDTPDRVDGIAARAKGRRLVLRAAYGGAKAKEPRGYPEGAKKCRGWVTA